MARICVYCGSNTGNREIYAIAARELANVLVAHDFGLVYGGADKGIMGVIANAVLAQGGEVHGVIPTALSDKEIAHQSLTALHVVASMHERKTLMAELSDGFIAMPGGFGTLEEIIEILTWGQLQFHSKPCGLLNIDGYFDHLLHYLDHAVDEGFLRPENRQMLLCDETPEGLLKQFAEYAAPRVEKVDELAPVTDAAEALRSVAAVPPNLPPEILAEALARDFGLRGELRQLVSERDQNFRLKTADGAQFVAKVVSTVEDAGVTECQVAALLHLEENGIQGVPRIVRTLTGNALAVIHTQDEAQFTLRVSSWLDGEPLDSTRVSESIAKAIGRKLGQLDQALSDFSHPHDAPILLWDMQRAAQLISLTQHIDNTSVRRQVLRVLQQFRDHTSRQLQSLPQQVIHNDANPSNLLLQKDRVAVTVIDFGDVVRAARVIEVAVAAAYLRDEGEPLRFILPLVSAYHRVNPLQEAERDVLYDLIRTRLAMTICILYWRLSARDENDPYRRQSLASEQDAFGFLDALDALGRDEFSQQIARQLVAV